MCVKYKPIPRPPARCSFCFSSTYVQQKVTSFIFAIMPRAAKM